MWTEEDTRDEQDADYAHFEGSSIHGLRSAAADLAGIGYTLEEMQAIVAQVFAEIREPAAVELPVGADPIPF